MRDRFLLPDGPDGPDGPPAIYLAGQSLGLQPRSARVAVEEVLDRWARLGVDGWFTAERPWFTEDDALREPMARIVGARPAEIAILNSLTVNLHAAPDVVLPAGRPAPPDPRRCAALPVRSARADEPPRLARAGPDRGPRGRRATDRRGHPPAGRPGGRHRATTGRTSRWSSSPASTSRPDRSSTSSGSRPPGMPPGRPSCGTWPMRPATSSWRSTTGASTPPSGAPTSTSTAGRARSARSSSTSGSTRTPRSRDWPAGGGATPSDGSRWTSASCRPTAPPAGRPRPRPMLAMAPLAASLAIFDEVGMPALRSRSVALTGYLAEPARRRWRSRSSPRAIRPPGAPSCRCGSSPRRAPRPCSRGLAARGVVSDFRAPDLIRLAPMPLYTSYHDAWAATERLREALG